MSPDQKQEKQEKQEKSCFIITPISGNNTEVRRKADGVIETVIIPVLERHKFTDIKASHFINITGSINNQIVTRILNDDLVIANLTDLNPNVMYELAIRHATMKPIVHICENSTNLPFDIKDQRTIMYTNDILGAKELERSLFTMVEEVMKLGKCDDNPIYSAAKRKIIEEIVNKNGDTKIQKYMLDRMDSMEDKLNRIVDARVPSLSRTSSSFSEPKLSAFLSIDTKMVFEVDAASGLKPIEIVEEIFKLSGIEVLRFKEKKAKDRNYMEIEVMIRGQHSDDLISDLVAFIELNKKLDYSIMSWVRIN